MGGQPCRNARWKLVRQLSAEGCLLLVHAPHRRFESGERLGFEMVIEASEPIDDPVVGVAIYNHLDNLVYGTNTAMRDMPLGTLSGRCRVRFDFGPIPMVEGQYFITVAVHSRDEQLQYVWLERQVSFKVFSLSVDSGVLHLDPAIEIEPA